MDSGAATPNRPSPLRRTWATPRTSPSRARVSASSSGDARRRFDQVTTDNFDLQPSWSPDGRKIALSRRIFVNGEWMTQTIITARISQGNRQTDVTPWRRLTRRAPVPGAGRST
jgi:Tol biopolymer transport system component